MKAPSRTTMQAAPTVQETEQRWPSEATGVKLRARESRARSDIHRIETGTHTGNGLSWHTGVQSNLKSVHHGSIMGKFLGD